MATAAALSAAAAAGVQLTGHALQLAILELDVPRHMKHTLTAIAAHQNDEALKANPSYDRLAKGCGVVRRTAFERVDLCTRLTLEANGVVLVKEARWASDMRPPSDKSRANVYRMYWSPEIAARVGWKLQLQSLDSRPAGGILRHEADGAGAAGSAPNYWPPSSSGPDMVCNAPGSPDTGPAGAATGKDTPSKETSVSSPPPPQGATLVEGPRGVPAVIETPVLPPSCFESEEARQVREALLAQPETRDLADLAAKWLGLGRGAGKTVAHILEDLADLAKKSEASEPRPVRRSRGVSFLLAEKKEKKKPAPSVDHRALAQKEHVEKTARNRVDAITARQAIELGLALPVAPRPGPSSSKADLAAAKQKQRADLAFLAWQEAAEAEKKPP